MNATLGCGYLPEGGEEAILEFAAYVRREGRITLPKEVRDALSIDEGCLVRVKVEKVSKVRSQR